MMKKTIYLALLSLLPVLLLSQSYDLAMGMRLGTDWGLTLQQRIAKKTTIEAIFQSSLLRNESMVTVLGEHHMPFITRRFNLYTGAGLHTGWSSRSEEDGYKNPLGLSLIAGLELSLGKLNLSYDIKPAMNFRGGDQFLYVQSGLSVRYVLVKRDFLLGDPKKKRKRQRERRKRKRKRDNDESWKFWKDW
jgi:hypothetical protein